MDGWTHCWVEERMNVTKLLNCKGAQQGEGTEMTLWLKAFAAKTEPEFNSCSPRGRRGQLIPAVVLWPPQANGGTYP